MITQTLIFDLLSYWHIGSGRGAAALADAVVVRDDAGLPFLPGRTVKGLVRDAMELAAAAEILPPERVLQWFGSSIPGDEQEDGDFREKKIEGSRYSTEPGVLWFGSATLPDSWRQWAQQASASKVNPIVSELFTFVASTAITQEGVADEQTLRVREVTVPITLSAQICGPADPSQWIQDITASLPLLRCLGSRRQRGFGRVRVSLQEV
jgi:hypothetical protein